MTSRNRTHTIRVPLSLDPATDGVLEDLAHIGIFGKNKAEVASTILRQWIWNNSEKLKSHGIRLRKSPHQKKGSASRW